MNNRSCWIRWLFWEMLVVVLSVAITGTLAPSELLAEGSVDVAGEALEIVDGEAQETLPDVLAQSDAIDVIEDRPVGNGGGISIDGGELSGAWGIGGGSELLVAQSDDDPVYNGMFHYRVVNDSEVYVTGPVEDLHYDSNGKVSKRDYCMTTSLDVPSTIGGLPVTHVGGFSGCPNLTTVKLPEGLRVIEMNAFFSCPRLSSVSVSTNPSCNFPASLTQVCAGAFYNTGLTSVVIPKNMKTHPYTADNTAYKGVFGECQHLTSITFEEGTTDITCGWCWGAPALTTINLPSTVQTIAYRAFCNCDALVAINLPAGLATIGKQSFAYCDALTEVELPSSVTLLDTEAFGNCTSLASVNIPKNARTNNYCAENSQYQGPFSGCTALRNVAFEKGIETISRGLFYKNVGIKSIVIPDTVKTIESSAFWGCVQLESVTLGSSVETIDIEAFQNCTALSGSLVLPQSLKRIGCGAFRACSNLTSVNIPRGIETTHSCGEGGSHPGPFFACSGIKSVTFAEGITTIPSGLFNGCNGIEELDVPDTVETIGRSAFYSMTALRRLSLPKGLESLGRYAFGHNADDLTIKIQSQAPEMKDNVLEDKDGWTVYVPSNYWDEYAEWRDTYPSIEWLQDDALPFNVRKARSIEGAVFSFRSSLSPTNTMSYTVDYDDEWLFSNSGQDTYSLLKTSIRAAMAAFGTKGDNDATNIVHLMDKLGFEYTKSSIEYPKPTQNTIGYAIGMKNVRLSGGGEHSIIMVVLRGGGYGKEWGNNFRVGTGDTHEGFASAAEKVWKGLESFYDENGAYIHGNAKIWICGYSRGAATANLLAQRLIDEKDKFGATARDVRAFCFECPQNVVLDTGHATNARYGSIINIVNPIDFVPKVAFSAIWGFTRYGKTYYIPSRETTWGYADKKSKMINKYRGLLRYWRNDLSYSDKLHAEGLGQAYLLDAWMADLAIRCARPTYSMIEGGVCDSVAAALGGDTGYGENKVESIGKAFEGVSRMSPGLFILNKLTDVALCTNLMNAHYPELCLSWVDSLGGFDAYNTNQTNKYVKIFVNCPVDVDVYDSWSNGVGGISGGVADEDAKVVTLVDENDQQVIVLPMDERFEIELSATGNGGVTYTVVEFNSDTGQDERVVSYKDVAVERGDTLTGGMEQPSDDEPVTYTLAIDGERIVPDLQASGDTVNKYQVMASALEGGAVKGGGVFVETTFCKLIATPDEGQAFVGWYEDDALVSRDSEYRFCVEGNRDLEARFTVPFFLDADPADDNNHGAEVDWMGRAGISTGWEVEGGREFRGMLDVKRCDFAAFLYRMGDLADDGERNDSNALTDEQVEATLATVSDCSPDKTSHAMEVAWMIREGISTGWPDKGKATVSFRPMAKVARQDMAAFLYRFADLRDNGVQDRSLAKGAEKVSFSDVRHGDEANHATEVEWLASVGVTKGWSVSGGKFEFRGKKTVARQDMAAFMSRLNNRLNP